MTHVKVQLFGRIQVINNDQPIDLKSRKALALIAYLALTQQPHSRDRLAALLWPESDEKRAHNSLSRSLYQLNRTPLAEWLETEADAVALETQAVVVDVNRFDQLLEQWRTHNHPPAQLCSDCLADLSVAVGLYQDDFLADFYLADANDFESWTAAQRQRLRRQMLRVLEALAQTYAARAEFDRTRRYARRQLELDDLQEPAIRLLLESLARTGRRREALAEFERYKARMWEELGLEVSSETQTLIEAIRSGDLDPVPAGPQTPSATKPVTTERQKPVDRRPLRILLDKVKSFWVEGVLENSLHGAALLELGMELRPGEVDYPWGLVIQRPGEERYALPGGLSMADVFDDNGQALLILGEPGSGKTTMMLDLARTLVQRAEAGDRHLIPVVFNLSSWRSGPLINWLEIELNEKYLIPRKIGRQWLADDQLLPLLDGLDEVNIDRRDDCVQAINEYRQAHGLVPLVVCSRVSEYEELAVKLKLENAVLLQPLSDAQIDNYLAAAGGRLEALRQKLAIDAEMREMARTPLMLSIMSLTYQDSAETAVNAGMGSGQRERQVFESYLDRMYDRRMAGQQYSRAQTDGWLTWLAAAMEQRGETIFLIESLQPTWLNKPGIKVAYYYLSRFIAVAIMTFFPLSNWVIWQLTYNNYGWWADYLSVIGPLLTFSAFFSVMLASL
ncbi:MAG: BTAD domain-containing putative transcriptional regulator, partial [Candidatus Promineifilaceae bacterium]